MLLNSTQSSFLSSIHLCVFFLSPFLSVSAAARSARFFFLFSFFLFSNLTIFPGFSFLVFSVCLFVSISSFCFTSSSGLFFFVFCFFCCIYHVLSPVRLSHIFCMCVCVAAAVVIRVPNLHAKLICLLGRRHFVFSSIEFILIRMPH